MGGNYCKGILILIGPFKVFSAIDNDRNLEEEEEEEQVIVLNR